MDKTLLELLKEAKGMDKNRSQEQIFNAGFKAGVQCMMDKIERQYQLGKPILANDNLYWLKGAKENLWNHGVYKYSYNTAIMERAAQLKAEKERQETKEE